MHEIYDTWLDICYALGPSHISSDCGSGARPTSKLLKICRAPGAPDPGPSAYLPIFTHWQGI